jgi:hypothetical protein
MLDAMERKAGAAQLTATSALPLAACDFDRPAADPPATAAGRR